MRIFFLLLFNLLAGILWSQFGLSAEYTHYPVIELETEANENIWDSNYKVSFDYWRRLKNYRVEFLPTLSYQFSPSSTSKNWKRQAYQIHLKTNVYIFDIENDCNCPTFSKQGNWLTKGTFLQLLLGYSREHVQYDDQIKGYDYGQLGIGIGYDFGISDLITLSPYLNYLFSLPKSDLFQVGKKVSNNNISAGLRIGLRPDYARPSARRRRAIGY